MRYPNPMTSRNYRGILRTGERLMDRDQIEAALRDLGSELQQSRVRARLWVIGSAAMEIRVLLAECGVTSEHEAPTGSTDLTETRSSRPVGSA